MPLTREFTEKEQIAVFDSGLNSSLSIYDSRLLKDQEDTESKHFWFKTRRDKICRFFEKKIQREEKILEIGGGTGFIAQRLAKLGFSIEMADIHLNGLRYAKEKGIGKLYQFDLYKPPFQEEFDAICLFDVLEHQKDDKQAIECLKKMIKPRGKIILTVPAHQWLWNRDDRINGHYRRYTKKTLIELCRACDLEVKHIEYFFIFIVPLLFVRSLLNRDRKEEVDGKEKLKFELPFGVNKICYAMTKMEFSLSRWLPNVSGGSLLLMAQKREGS